MKNSFTKSPLEKFAEDLGDVLASKGLISRTSLPELRGEAVRLIERRRKDKREEVARELLSHSFADDEIDFIASPHAEGDDGYWVDVSVKVRADNWDN